MPQDRKAIDKENENLMARMLESAINEQPVIDLHHTLHAEKLFRKMKIYIKAGFTPEHAFELCKLN